MKAVNKSKGRYLYLEYLRVLCALFVIVIHVSGANWFKLEVGQTDWIVQTFFNVSARFSVCIFCMITGALLLRPGKEISMHDILTKYVKRILICYLAWIVLYALFYTLVNHEGMQYFISRLFKLPDHLWYLLMLIGLYIAYPALRLIAQNRSVTRYLILVLVALSTLSTLTGITGFFETMAGEDFGYSLWTGFLGNMESLTFPFVPGYLGLFLLGHYIHEYGLGAWHRRIVVAAIPALLLSALLTVWISTITGAHVYTFMLETNPLVFLACAGIFAFFRGTDDVVQREEPRSQASKVLVWMAGYTFGIYLIHFAVRDFLSIVCGVSVASYPAILSVPINSLVIFAVSLVLAMVFKRIPGLKSIVS